MTRFGPAGNEEAFSAAGHKSTVDAPAYVASLGLNAYEYQCGRGVRVSPEHGAAMRAAAEAAGVQISVHAPYFISLASPEEEKRDNSIRYLLESCAAVKAMGGNRVILHPGSPVGKPRAEAMELAARTLVRAREACDAAGFAEILFCPETMGKQNQLGTVAEIAELCALDERILPCIDFGHINAREGGILRTEADYEAIFDALVSRIGRERTARFHAHFSRIQYGAGGEVRHLTFEDAEYGPFFEPLGEVIARRGYEPTVICESAGTQARDAASMCRKLLEIKERS